MGSLYPTVVWTDTIPYNTVCVYAGDVNSGKSTLVDRLCQISMSHPIGGKFPLSGCSLEYRFIDVQDEETEGV